MPNSDLAAKFAELHIPGNPLLIYNVWDAGSAKAIEDAGAEALATGSWSVAAAQGYSDGEQIPLPTLLAIIARITTSCSAPLSVDFEGGYSSNLEDLSENTNQLLQAGAIGINFEDRVVGGSALVETAQQCERLNAIRSAAQQYGTDLFINARTDVFLKAKDPSEHADLLGEAIDRAAAYADASADGFFAPGLREPALIEKLCSAVKLPVNIMMMDGMAEPSPLARLGVARISCGPNPYIAAMASAAQGYREFVS